MVSLVGIVFGADFLVTGAVSIARKYKVSDFVSGAAIKKNTSMALGNIVGSNIFYIALILGLCSQVSPLTSVGIGIVDFMVMIAAVLVLFAFSKDCKINRAEGMVLFLCFVPYTCYLITNQIS